METKTYKINWFVTYFKHAIEKRTNAKLNCFNYNIALKHLEIFTSGNDVPFNQISTEWFDSLKKYFNEAKGLRCEKLLSRNSANSYFSIITTVAREAANDGFLSPEIVSSIKNLGSRTHALSSALSLEELHRLVNTNCSSMDLKKAFVFSCLTGMQWKDIEILTWNQVQPNEDGMWKVIIHRNDNTCIPLSTQAREILGVAGHYNNRIFKIKYTAALCVSLSKWTLRAGITRNVKFHSARQTFGKLLLDQGVELELISELLNHKHLKTTSRFLSVKAEGSLESHYLRSFNV